MPRAAKSRVEVEIEDNENPDSWFSFQDGFETISAAEQWIKDNIRHYGEVRLRAVRIAGVFSKETKIIKR